MEPQYRTGSGSTAAIRGHPIHPMLVPLPIGFMVAAFASDLIHYMNGDPFWARFAYWLLLGTLVSGALAALVGIVDLMSLRRARTMGLAWAHAIGNVIALALVLVNFRIRMDQPELPPVPQGLLLSTVIVAMMVITGWAGGEMTFRHGLAVSRGVGVGTERGDEDETPSGRPDVGKA